MLLEEILSYIEETVQLAGFPACPAAGEDPVAAKLYDILKLEQTHSTLKLRTTDMKKNITGCMPYSARGMANVMQAWMSASVAFSAHSGLHCLTFVIAALSEHWACLLLWA